MKPPRPVTSPAPKTPGCASSVAGSTFSQPRSVCARPAARQASALARRPVATSRRSARHVGARLQADDDAPSSRGPVLARRATHGSPIESVMPSASRCGRSAAPASGSSRPRNVGPASITVTCEPRRAKAWPSSTPMAPPPRIASEAGSSRRNRRLAVGPEVDACRGRGSAGSRRCCRWRSPRRGAPRAVRAPTCDGARVGQLPVAANEPVRRSLRPRRPGACRRGRAPSTARASRPSGKSTAQSTREAASVSRALGLAQRLARAQQRLRRHAAPVRALAADQLALDDRERQPAALKPAAIASPATPPPRQTTSNCLGHRSSAHRRRDAGKRKDARAPPRRPSDLGIGSLRPRRTVSARIQPPGRSTAAAA